MLIVMECFSRKIFVTPMKSKSALNTVNHFKDIHLHIGYTPESIYVDKGSEFNSNIFKNYCSENSIKLIFSYSVNKASLVERCQRTLQGIMFKFMERYNTKRYIDYLKDIVSTYNSKTNRTLKLSPNNAYLKINYTKTMKNLEKHYSKAFKTKKTPRYKVGNKVRISKIPKEGTFRKGYKPTFSEEVFTVVKVDCRLPQPRYFLQDSNEESIIGSFQEHELSIIRTY